MSSAIDSIAVLRLSALGDVTLVLPTVRRLQRALPGARITWITTEPAHQLLSGLGGIEFEVLPKPRSLSDIVKAKRQLRARRFDVLLAMQASFRANLLIPMIRAPLKIGFDRQRAHDGQWLFTNRRIPFSRDHLLDSFLSFATELGIEDESVSWELPIGEADDAWAEEQISGGQRCLVVHPSASKPERNWLPSRYIDAIKSARKRWDLRVVLSGGGAQEELSLVNEIAAGAGNGIASLAGRTTPKQLAALLKRADCLLAPDTGPVHIATAVGTPIVGLYAVAPPELSGPYKNMDLVVNRYPQAVSKFLDTHSESIAWGTRVHTKEAMALIRVDDVLERLERVFGTE